MINNEVNLKLTNGELVNLCLNFKSLLKVKNNYPDIYDSFNKVVLYGTQKDTYFFELLSVIYAGYLCANIENKDRYTFEEFRDLIPLNMKLISDVQATLLGYRKN